LRNKEVGAQKQKKRQLVQLFPIILNSFDVQQTTSAHAQYKDLHDAVASKLSNFHKCGQV
jgi:hypothetical protein